MARSVARHWKGLRLHRLQLDYEAGRDSLAILADRHETHAPNIVRMARRYGWKSRTGAWEPAPLPPLLAYIEAKRRGDQA